MYVQRNNVSSHRQPKPPRTGFAQVIRLDYLGIRVRDMVDVSNYHYLLVQVRRLFQPSRAFLLFLFARKRVVLENMFKRIRRL